MQPIEMLEPRRMLSASLDGKTLMIVGTSGKDVFDVTLSGDNKMVFVDQHLGAPPVSFTAASFSAISVDLGAGDDAIHIAPDLKTPATISGGRGRDTFQTGTGDDYVDGGTEEDTVD